jgi:hypothetical protein
MVRMTPYGLVLKLSWGNERPASFNFTLGKRFLKKSAKAISGQ